MTTICSKPIGWSKSEALGKQAMNSNFDTQGDAPAFSRSPPGAPWLARFSLPGSALSGRDGDEYTRLWLLFSDGRVLVFRLRGVPPDDALATVLAEALASDLRGDVLEPDLKAAGWVGILYGAPASPVFCVDPKTPAYGKALAFQACLDSDFVALLASLAAHNSFWASARNYSRLTIHARRHERIQALRRYPMLVAPLLLTHQRWPNLFDIKRFRWRAHDDAMVAAIDEGRDLTGALARHYGISRSLVRSPFCAQPWSGTGGRALGELLQFLDGIPAQRRPASCVEIDRYSQHLPALWSLFGPAWHRAAVAFREGFGVVWERLQRRFDSPEMRLNSVLVDAQDYLRALAAWLQMQHRHRRTPGEIVVRWASERGLASLLAASLRWHSRLPPVQPGNRDRLPESVTAIIGTWSDGAWTARELTRWQALVEEGDSMHHCIDTYWSDCVMDGYRVFSLMLDSSIAETTASCRATALYVPAQVSPENTYRLSDVRGLSNADVDEPMWAFAERLAQVLNAPEHATARRAAQQFIPNKESGNARTEALAARVDTGSIAVLNALFELPELAPEAPASHLYAPVAGYGYAFDAEREQGFAVGQPLALIREPDNAADPLAIRIEWTGQKIGYVPRPDNAHFAIKMDAGGKFEARIDSFRPQAPMWQRLWFRIDPL
jgi:hypothetical protein